MTTVWTIPDVLVDNNLLKYMTKWSKNSQVMFKNKIEVAC
jgi:hypothetical protein